MHVLILGANGMLGRALVRVFGGNEVTAWDRSELDITDEQAVSSHLPMVSPDVVINAAASTDVERAEEEPDEADEVNGHAVGNLAVTCAEANIPLLHISTDFVFDGQTTDGYRESDEPRNPVNAYGRSKLLGETLLRENAPGAWLVRTAWLFGPGGKHFVDKILAAAETRAVLQVVADQRGNPTYAPDLASAIKTLLEDQPPYGVYHLVNSEPTTWADFAAEILQVSGSRAQVQPIPAVASPSPVRRPQCSVLLNTKRPALRSWRAALAEYLRMRQQVRS